MEHRIVLKRRDYIVVDNSECGDASLFDRSHGKLLIAVGEEFEDSTKDPRDWSRINNDGRFYPISFYSFIHHLGSSSSRQGQRNFSLENLRSLLQ